jgi:UMF1 family MFS transporter
MKKLVFTREKVGWICYDFANQSFVTIIVTVLFSMYFKDIVVARGEYGTFLWGIAVSISMACVALLAPVMGAMADYSGYRKRLLFITTYITIYFTLMLYFVNVGDILLGMILFIVANFFFQISYVFYNSFLPIIFEKHEISRVSGIAWGIGYLGGLATLFMIMPIIGRSFPENWGAHFDFRLAFIIVGTSFAVFSLPTFIYLRERKIAHIRTNYWVVGFKRVFHTARDISKYIEIVKFLIAFFCYNNGIYVVISFAAIYGLTRFDMEASEMIIYFLIAQPSSFIGAFSFGYLADRIGTKNSINISLILWIIVITGAFLAATKYQFYLVGIGAGFVMGSSQANSRTMLAQFTPPEKSSEFFGFFSLTTCLSAILGPLFYGLISSVSGDQRYAILSIIFFFVLGLIVMQFVKEKK